MAVDQQKVSQNLEKAMAEDTTTRLQEAKAAYFEQNPQLQWDTREMEEDRETFRPQPTPGGKPRSGARGRE